MCRLARSKVGLMTCTFAGHVIIASQCRNDPIPPRPSAPASLNRLTQAARDEVAPGAAIDMPPPTHSRACGQPSRSVDLSTQAAKIHFPPPDLSLFCRKNVPLFLFSTERQHRCQHCRWRKRERGTLKRSIWRVFHRWRPVKTGTPHRSPLPRRGVKTRPQIQTRAFKDPSDRHRQNGGNCAKSHGATALGREKG